jgi:hypothetical protein
MILNKINLQKKKMEGDNNNKAVTEVRKRGRPVKYESMDEMRKVVNAKALLRYYEKKEEILQKRKEKYHEIKAM